jgi:hypothetical protein
MELKIMKHRILVDKSSGNHLEVKLCNTSDCYVYMDWIWRCHNIALWHGFVLQLLKRRVQIAGKTQQAETNKGSLSLHEVKIRLRYC